MNAPVGRTFASVLGLVSLLSAPLSLACSPEQPAFRGNERRVTLAPGESAHFTLVASRAAIDQAHNGMVFSARTEPYLAGAPLTTVPDDVRLDELFTGANGAVSSAELARTCPETNECILGVTLTLGASASSSVVVVVRFGLESYDGFNEAAVAGATAD